MIKVVASGLYSSLQDQGRFGFRNYGVPVSGAMDRQSATHANLLVGNLPNVTVLEFTATGPVLEFNENAVIAISGATFSPVIDGEEMGMNTPFSVSRGNILSFGSPSKGLRAYVAIRGGFTTEKILGSDSFYKGVTGQGKLKKGDIIRFDAIAENRGQTNAVAAPESLRFDREEIEVFKGPEFELLSTTVQNTLKNTSFTVDGQSNRMAYWLEHSEAIYAEDIVTAPVQPGTVQITPAGKVIVLMRDAQTTGGYARIFQLTNTAIDQLSQKRAGESLRFKIIDPLFDTPV